MRRRTQTKVRLEKECDIQQRIVDLLEAAGAMVVENRSQKWDALATARAARNSAARQRAKGQVDLIVALPGGGTLWIEVKRPGEKPTIDQVQHHAGLRILGHLVIVATGHEEILAWADTLLRKPELHVYCPVLLAFAQRVSGFRHEPDAAAAAQKGACSAAGRVEGGAAAPAAITPPSSNEARS